eukprot:CAMPEP_0168442648 /NCGR_PEP_ID=MMETSP0228-20121227/44120_1 /TAXON_ID=133427 /ORGANISM="Protoceratium reticulatum, Strain CCCM 535 (=CCMP 1889)" /LENGTH=127 /DNA_ID=CAMNT_0008457023 /DNA_START=62 /DNA_END=445 /DNA_ORIENTATION=-
MPPAKRQRTCTAGRPDVTADVRLEADSGEELELGCPAAAGDLKGSSMNQRQVSDASTEVPEEASGEEEDRPKAVASGPIGVFDWGAWPKTEVETAPAAVVAIQAQGAGCRLAPETLREILDLPLAAF